MGEIDLIAAFPARFAADARVAVEVMPPPRLWNATPFEVEVDGETVAIPDRLYHVEPTPAAESGLTATQRLILDCLYTRNNDGWVRQRRLATLLDSTEPFVAPFVLKLVGEYVLEIVRTIEDAAPGPYPDFAARNPAFVGLTMARVISYWNEYYRRSYRGYRDYHDYPGYRVLRRLTGSAGNRSSV
ncbi:hypothetical protein [Kutzneria sp. 744]|uniref:hypothetical protein n=1 Tax=Kutzneria sp. (strain 744) TaxID=345341 RepID=UPI0003EEBA67|nr:hypothetical protein [Kutzneria sp. 744]EWM13456.1 hypothetical protein KUTG_03760 [Kutzneria sp. 744]